MVLTGAGVSTASGIPDFRSPGGVWERFDPDEFHISRFQADPDRFWQRRVRLLAAMDYLDAEPNEAHHLLAEAARDGRIETVVTQNVDGLHLKAGTPPDRLIEVHGNGSRVVCMACFRREPVLEALRRRSDRALAPRCEACGGLQKPDVVLFGEAVMALEEAADAVAACGSLIAAGSSLQVHPVAGLVGLAASTGKHVVICNRDPTPYDAHADQVLREDVADALRSLLSPVQ